LGTYIEDLRRIEVLRRSIRILFESTNYNGLTWAYSVLTSIDEPKIYIYLPHGFGRDLPVRIEIK